MAVTGQKITGTVGDPISHVPTTFGEGTFGEGTFGQDKATGGGITGTITGSAIEGATDDDDE